MSNMQKKVISVNDEPVKISATCLNIGCGSLAIKGWENIDCDASLISWFELENPDLLPFFKLQNVLKEFNYANESIDRIYLSNFIEHLEPIECRRLLANCLNALKVGGRIRILVPDMNKVLRSFNNNQMDMYNSGQPEMFKSSSPSSKLAYILFGNLYNADQNYPKDDHYLGHKMAYNSESLNELLDTVGFMRVMDDSSRFEDILEFEKQHLPMWYMLAIEAEK